LNITKLDVLSGIPEIEVATHYTLDGRKLDGQMPACYSDLVRVKVHTEKLPGWTEDIS
jgi:adenylosuccinate synthase